MRPANNVLLVLVTSPNMKIARKIARAVLTARLAACANIVPGIESHYWWQGKLDTSAEALIILKTTGNKLPRLEKAILENHPYDTPEVISVPVKSGNAEYLNWLVSSMSNRTL